MNNLASHILLGTLFSATIIPFTDYSKDKDYTSPFVSENAITHINILGCYSLILILYFDLSIFLLPCFVCIPTALFLPYLRKASPYYTFTTNGMIREWSDKLIVTSGIYLISAIIAFFYGFYQLSFLCMCTSIGSASYHRFKEGKFFNFDSIYL